MFIGAIKLITEVKNCSPAACLKLNVVKFDISVLFKMCCCFLLVQVMASAGLVTVRFIIRYTHSPRLIPIITQNLNSKSKDIRRACCEFLEQLLHSWSTHSLERHIALLQDAIKKGIADADPEARLCARK